MSGPKAVTRLSVNIVYSNHFGITDVAIGRCNWCYRDLGSSTFVCLFVCFFVQVNAVPGLQSF